MAATIAPITGILRRSLVLDLSTAFGKPLPVSISPPSELCTYGRGNILNGDSDGGLSFGTTFGYLWWYGYHLPRVRARDNYYNRLEQERAAGQA
ncbi:hypothetical protein BJY04DRAFT_223886 [Aspergillus karnatakaensis]|uniref:cytochrome c oxidase subunit VIIa n=1 Tax=Aspergillus karnatakaensis TaxID=1810916 RepID=UPI003CCE1858